jgi:importin subunit alpha-1
MGVLAAIPVLLKNPRAGIRKETCWAISNLTAGNAQQIGAVIEAALVCLSLSSSPVAILTLL